MNFLKAKRKTKGLVRIVTLGLCTMLFLNAQMTTYAYTEEEKEAAKAWLIEHGYPPDRGGAQQAYQDYLDGKFDDEINGGQGTNPEQPDDGTDGQGATPGTDGQGGTPGTDEQGGTPGTDGQNGTPGTDGQEGTPDTDDEQNGEGSWGTRINPDESDGQKDSNDTKQGDGDKDSEGDSQGSKNRNDNNNKKNNNNKDKEKNGNGADAQDSGNATDGNVTPGNEANGTSTSPDTGDSAGQNQQGQLTEAEEALIFQALSQLAEADSEEAKVESGQMGDVSPNVDMAEGTASKEADPGVKADEDLGGTVTVAATEEGSESGENGNAFQIWIIASAAAVVVLGVICFLVLRKK